MNNKLDLSKPEGEHYSSRTEAEVLADLEQVCQEHGFFYTFCLMVSSNLWMTADEMATRDWYKRPNEKELSLVFGLLAKRAIQLNERPTDAAILQQISKVLELLEDLHRLLSAPRLPMGYAMGKDPKERLTVMQQNYEEWMKSGRGTVEPIFYGGSGAYDFQYLELALKRYAKDRQWILENKGATLEAFVGITKKLSELSQERLKHFKEKESLTEKAEEVLSAMSFCLDDLPTTNSEALEHFIRTFSFTPGSVNGNFKGVGDYNEVHARPVMEVGNGQYCIPIYANLPESIYESPFYWMQDDKQYEVTARANRGKATESIAHELLASAFTHGKVFKDVKVKIGKTNVTDIDALAICGNKAVIAQCKSKKLTLEARRGDGRALRNDFIKAVQGAYDQALKSRRALLDGSYTLADSNGNAISLPENMDEAYILCVTGDHYPAVITQARILLEKSESDPHPILLSIFDLDVIASYLNDPYDFLYYLRQRSAHAVYFMANSEMDLLGFHLKRKLFPDDEYDMTMLDPGYAQLIDANFLTARGNWPKGEESEKLFHTWRNESFEELVRDVKLTANSGDNQAATEDLLFFLYDLAGKAADNLIRMAKDTKRKTAIDGKLHDLRIPFSKNRKGITFVSFPRPTTDIQEQTFCRKLEDIAMFHKYRSQADEWMVLASIEGSTSSPPALK